MWGTQTLEVRRRVLLRVEIEGGRRQIVSGDIGAAVEQRSCFGREHESLCAARRRPEAHVAAKPYPYPVSGSIRNEVFTRRGGMYFGIAHLLG